MELATLLVILTLIVGFYMAWNIGANDVANAMGTSVGSGALTLKRAVIIAAILEFAGAFLVGSTVSETIQRGIIDPQIFADSPKIFVYGMMGSLFATGIWLQLASYFGLPVSTTHAIVGAVLGFGGVIGGAHAVHWGQVGSIVASWIISPLMSGILAYFVFGLIQKKILFALNPLQATKRLAPYLVFFVFSFITVSILFDGLKNLHLGLTLPMAIFISFGVGIIGAIIALICVRNIPVDKYKVTPYHHPAQVISLEKAMKHLERVKLSSHKETNEKTTAILEEVRSLTETVKHETQFSKRTSEYGEVEKMFVYLQILSASLVAFAHGANDVANAIGPVAAVMDVLKTGAIPLTSSMPTWLLALGGAGIVIGLATWGWRVIETIGKKITELTPTRGFSAEFSAAATILLASKLGLPISTTHALVGAVLGVGFARGLRAINLHTLRDIALSWVVTIPICAALSIIVFYVLLAIF